MSHAYDLLVIGSGPGGQKAAIQGAKLGRRVALVERNSVLGGVSVNSGTIPSKTVREAILYLTGLSRRGIYGAGYRLKDVVTVEDLRAHASTVVERERQIVRDQLLRNGVTLVEGTARFVDPLSVTVDVGGDTTELTAPTIVVATGSEPSHPAGVEFDGRTVVDSDGLTQLPWLPTSVTVVGAGVIGLEFASMFAALGSKVTVVDRRPEMLDFIDTEIREALRYHLRDLGVIFRFGETVTEVETMDGGTLTTLSSGKQVASDAVLYSAGRRGATEPLDLRHAGIEADERGRIPVDPGFRTAAGHVYAVGDVIGFPSLASTSAEQGRIAACIACGLEPPPPRDLLPIGIYTIPEISYVGRTEAELTRDAIPYEVGKARYRELARGAILGESYGLLKLLVSGGDGTLLGVHAFGANATEIIHIGQMTMALGGTVDDLVEAVFNYPTFAEAYKVAALDAQNKRRAVARLTG